LRFLAARLLFQTDNERMSTSRGLQASEESDTSSDTNAECRNEPFSEPCPHLETLEQDLKTIAKNRISNPALWNCEECATTESVWVCLSCGHFGCGRFQRGHAKQHYKKTKHPVVLEINDKLCYCYECDGYIANDTQQEDLEKIRRLLDEEQTQTTTKSKRKRNLRSSAIFQKGPQNFQREDKLMTVIKHWRLYRLYRAFNKWKEVCKVSKQRRQQHNLQLSSRQQHNATSTCPNNNNNNNNNNKAGDETSKKREVSTEGNSVRCRIERTSRHRTRQRTKEVNVGEETSHNTSENTMATAPVNVTVTSPKKRRSPRGMPPAAVVREIMKPGETGLRNLGNTCFMNSVLQALSNTTLFREYFLNQLIPTDNPRIVDDVVVKREDTMAILDKLTKQTPDNELKNVLLTKEMHNLLRVLWSGNWAVVTPYSLLEGIWKCLPKFRSHQQQDVQEFLVYLLDRLQMELRGETNGVMGPSLRASSFNLRKSASAISALSSLTSSQLKPQQQSTQLPSQQSQSHEQPQERNDIINDIFEGHLLSEIVCANCKQKSEKCDSFMDISLEIPEDRVSISSRSGRHKNKTTMECTLEECIDWFMRGEELGAQTYFCEHCRQYTNASKQFFISKLPKVLIFVVKRFCWTQSSRGKIDTFIHFPLTNLNMAKYFKFPSTNTKYNTDADNTVNNRETSSSQSLPETRYCLRSIVIHHGTRLLSGHYTCYAYNEEKGAWINFNDSRVQVVTPEEVATSQAYMLFYERNDTFAHSAASSPQRETPHLFETIESQTTTQSDKKRRHPKVQSHEESESIATRETTRPKKRTKR
jgi:ubiquitin carboxyl-terminal hydrolase 44/49